MRCGSPKSCLRSPHKCAKAETSKPEGWLNYCPCRTYTCILFLPLGPQLWSLQQCRRRQQAIKTWLPGRHLCTAIMLRTTSGWISTSGSSALLTREPGEICNLTFGTRHLSERLRPASGTNLCAHFGHVRRTKGADKLVPSLHLKQRRKQYWPLELFWWKSQVIAQCWSWLFLLSLILSAKLNSSF